MSWQRCKERLDGITDSRLFVRAIKEGRSTVFRPELEH